MIEWLRIGREKKEDNLEKVLRENPLFQGLSNLEMKMIKKLIYLREYKEGEMIIKEGTPGMGMFIIFEGEVEVFSGGKKIVELKEGDFFGEMALIDESPRSGTVISKTKTKLIGFFKPELFGIINKKPSLGTKILLNLCKVLVMRLRQANEIITKME